MSKLSDEFKECYFMKTELVNLSKKLELPTNGSKMELQNGIIYYIKNKKQNKNIKIKKIKEQIPKKVPINLTPDTKLSEGYICNLITRNFFKKHIGDHFHFTYFLNEYVKNNPNKTYQDAINYWNYQYNNPELFKKKYEKTGKFEYNNFMKKYYEDHENASLDNVIKGWNEHKEKRNKKCKKTLQKLLDL